MRSLPTLLYLASAAIKELTSKFYNVNGHKNHEIPTKRPTTNNRAENAPSKNSSGVYAPPGSFRFPWYQIISGKNCNEAFLPVTCRSPYNITHKITQGSTNTKHTELMTIHGHYDHSPIILTKRNLHFSSVVVRHVVLDYSCCKASNLLHCLTFRSQIILPDFNEKISVSKVL